MVTECIAGTSSYGPLENIAAINLSGQRCPMGKNMSGTLCGIGALACRRKNLLVHSVYSKMQHFWPQAIPLDSYLVPHWDLYEKGKWECYFFINIDLNSKTDIWTYIWIACLCETSALLCLMCIQSIKYYAALSDMMQKIFLRALKISDAIPLSPESTSLIFLAVHLVLKPERTWHSKEMQKGPRTVPL